MSTADKSPEREYSAIEAARALDVDTNYLYQQLRLGRIAGHKVGEEWRIPETAIQERLKQRRGHYAGK